MVEPVSPHIITAKSGEQEKTRNSIMAVENMAFYCHAIVNETWQ